MPTLKSCSQCQGFVPGASQTCPHCDAAQEASDDGGWARKALNVVGGGAVAMTLMACYGGPPRPIDMEIEGPPQVTPACADQPDTDGDGFCLPEDCDELNPEIYPGAHDPEGDGIDQNCDGADGTKPAAVIAE